MSFRVRFFRSTTPFCWGVLRVEKLWSTPCSLQKSIKLEFSNSFPWSDLRQINECPTLFSSFKENKKFFKGFIFGHQEQGPSETRVVIHYYTHMPLTSSTHDPYRTTKINMQQLKRPYGTYTCFWFEGIFDLFPLAQASHALPSLYLMVGRPATRFFETNLFKREICMT